MVSAGAPNLPFDQIFPLISMFAVANSALINMLMASRLLYGMAKQRVLPPVLGRVLPGRRTPWVAILFTSALAVGLITVRRARSASSAARPPCCCSRSSPWSTSAAWCCARTRSTHKHFRAPTVLPIIGALCCAYLVGPWTGRDPEQYTIAGVLIGIGIVLWALTWVINRAIYGRKTYLKDPEALEGSETKD